MKQQSFSTRNIVLSGLIAAFATISAACADPDEESATNITPPETTPALTREERIEQRRRMQAPRNMEQPSLAEPTAVLGEVPADLLDKVMADLEQRTAANRSEFVVQRSEAVQWSDGSLGCPEPGQSYTHAIVNGFHVVVEHQGTTYDYRLNDRGFFKLCPGPALTM